MKCGLQGVGLPAVLTPDSGDLAVGVSTQLVDLVGMLCAHGRQLVTVLPVDGELVAVQLEPAPARSKTRSCQPRPPHYDFPVPHAITALIVREPFDDDAARDWDAVGVRLDHGLRLVHLSLYYTAYWQARRGETGHLDGAQHFPAGFPCEGVVATLAAEVTRTASGQQPTFVVAMTDYFGGIGDQFACAFVAGRRVPEADTINGALRVLGVRAPDGVDEFDSVGLGGHRSSPDALGRYVDLCDEMGV